ncbi:hypothetical protein P4K49_17920 [Bacillus cereus]|uniref:hypothetical protein n=1 Tax=Bacillus thuringiensis TaxID=1428 RepID=UPI000676C2D9|nr:hypothetical protein [Bacillus thuringiensis]MEB8874534.1 hypothetical protein [Bacillus cereus]AKR35036.1 Hypothetical protein NF53_1958 [Bacillus thuringiensis serovar indiana]MBG9644611.1 hypothetical protein [Bacillus thuringiensis]MBG9649915.1 hypothetical protein [Bacillus thuringiensis]MEB9618186.1 hypothetical protein [Bacillus cereus]
MKKYDKLIRSFEDYSITVILIMFSIVFSINKLLMIFYTSFAFSSIEKFITVHLKSFFIAKEGSLGTITAVFIGIYFTVFSILGSIKIGSTFATLTNKNLKKLVKFIKNALIGAFIFLFFLLSMQTFIQLTNWILIVIGFLLLLYVCLSAIRFGIVIYFIIKKDIENTHSNIEKEEIVNQKNQLLMHRLDNFLTEHEKIQSKKQAELMQHNIRSIKSTRKHD